ncbi:MAG: response regulator [Magnetococcus sp. WYHC-3]
MSPNSGHILVVDDEPMNRELLGEYLEEAGYVFDMAESGEQAWELVSRQPWRYRAVLLDRMMPGIDGIEVLHRMKGEPALSMVPVILQTAKVSREDILEGVRAGAHYYLTKPFSKEMLQAVVRVAVTKFDSFCSLRRELEHTAGSMALLEEAVFRFQSLEQARNLAALLSHVCPDPGRVLMGLSELLINAVEHGNLGITYGEKSQLNRDGLWQEEIARRLALPQYRDRWARVKLTRDGAFLVFRVEDCGQGFDWKNYMEIAPERAFDLHGRGIALARMISFDGLHFIGAGNVAEACVRLPQG